MVPAVPACLLGAALTPLPGLGPVVDWEKQLVVVLLDRQCWVHRDQSKERWEQLQLLVEMGRDLVALLHATCKWSEKKNIPEVLELKGVEKLCSGRELIQTDG